MNHLGHKPYKKRKTATAGIPVVYNGMRYASLTHLSKSIDVSYQRIIYYLRHDKPLKGHYLDYAI